MYLINNKKGSSTVFLAIILSALVAVSLSLIFTAREKTVISRTDAIVRLASESILSEFDYDVQKEYGIFMMKGSDDVLSNKLRDYVLYSTDSMKDVSLTNADATGGPFSVMNLDSVKDQIITYSKTSLDKTILENSGGGSAAESPNESGSSSGGSAGADSPPEEQGNTLDHQKDNDSEERSSRVLAHGPTIASLPSKLLPDKSLYQSALDLGERLTNVAAIFQESGSKFLFDNYVLQEFDNCLAQRDEAPWDPHFFRSEVEYILCGKLSDRENEKKTDNALKALRMGPNLTHLYTDPDKKSAIAAAAELLTPGPAAAATQLALSSAWALAESVNDVKLLHEGHRVPMFKTSENWATDLDNVINEISTGVIHPDTDSGFDYRQYLRILLFLKDDSVKTARILDLIQINMRQNHKGNFLVQEYFTGFRASLTVNDRELNYAWEY